jgi:hypothetical protein
MRKSFKSPLLPPPSFPSLSSSSSESLEGRKLSYIKDILTTIPLPLSGEEFRSGERQAFTP